jgi:probable F420-dependent oxidoreductase
MHVGIMFPYQVDKMADPGFLTEFAQTAEAAGFESVWVNEHMVVPTRIGEASIALHGSNPFVERGNVDRPDPLLTLCHVAAMTKTIKLGTGIMLLPQRNPVICAKEVATLDRLSGGRVLLGIGVGWLSEEAEAVGTPWHNRGARANEYIEAMRALWSDRVATYHGKYVNFDAVHCLPLPARPGGVPIIVGGGSAAAYRRAGRLGNGFWPIGVPLEELGAVFEQVRAEARAAGRDPNEIELTAAGNRDPKTLRTLMDLGVARLVVHNTRVFDAPSALRDIREVAAEIIPQVAQSPVAQARFDAPRYF